MYRIIISILTGIAVTIWQPTGAARADMCPLAKEMAARSLKSFETDRKKGLAGLIQARKYCPGDADIAYNLGLAYYKYKRPDMAYSTWSGLAKANPEDFKLVSNLAWLALDLGKVVIRHCFFQRRV